MTAPLVPAGTASIANMPGATSTPAATTRPRGAAEIIDLSFQLLRRNMAPLVSLAALYCVPVAIIQLTMMRRSMAVWGMLLRVGPAVSLTQGSNGTDTLGQLLVLLWALLLWPAFVETASAAYLGQPIDVGTALRRGAPRFWSMVGVAILTMLLVMFGFLLAVVGTFVFMTMTILAPCAAVLETAGPFAAIGRSSRLTRGLKWHVFVTLFFTWVILMLFYGMVMFAAYLLVSATHSVAWIPLVVACGAVFVYPLLALVQIALYYDARIRKEGFGAATS